jgi:hypothetical protein
MVGFLFYREEETEIMAQWIPRSLISDWNWMDGKGVWVLLELLGRRKGVAWSGGERKGDGEEAEEGFHVVALWRPGSRALQGEIDVRRDLREEPC